MSRQQSGSRGRDATVAKIGGSLLMLPGLRERLNRLLSDISRPVLVVGGGATANVVREWDATHSLNSLDSHKLAVKSMLLNAHFVSTLLERAEMVSHPRALEQAWSSGIVPVVDPESIVKRADPGELKRSWDVTSDSIAAWIAKRVEARELVLLKSCDVAAADLNSVSEAAQVDPEFSSLAVRLPAVSWLNFRHSTKFHDRIRLWNSNQGVHAG